MDETQPSPAVKKTNIVTAKCFFCGQPFEIVRRRGKPPIYDSDECRLASSYLFRLEGALDRVAGRMTAARRMELRAHLWTLGNTLGGK